MKIEDNLRVIKLIDTYGKLLTTKQFEVMTSYYFDNLSLSEVGDNYNISRQAVSDCINQSIKALESYEDKLHVIAKEDIIINELSAIARISGNGQVSDKINKIIETLRG